MDDDVGLQQAILSSLQQTRPTRLAPTRSNTNDNILAWNVSEGISGRHGNRENTTRGRLIQSRNRLEREGIKPTIPSSSLAHNARGNSKGANRVLDGNTRRRVASEYQKTLHEMKPDWIGVNDANEMDEDESKRTPAWLRESDSVPGWTPMCSGGRIQRQNSTGSHLILCTEEIYTEAVRLLSCSDLILLRSVAPLPLGSNKEEACFTAQVQNLTTRGQYSFLGLGITPKIGDEMRSFPVVMLHYDSRGGTFLSVELWHVTEEDKFSQLQVMEPMRPLRLIRDRINLKIVIEENSFSVFANNDCALESVEVRGVRLGQSHPIILSTGGRISVKNIAIGEGSEPPASKVYQQPSAPALSAPSESPSRLSRYTTCANSQGLPEKKKPLSHVKKGKVVKKSSNNVSSDLPANVDPELAAMVEAEIMDRSPKVNWEDIVGIEDAKRLLNEAVILPILVPELFTGVVQPWKGVLMFGPPGTGKTMLAKAVATSAKTTFFNISVSTLTNKHYGESEKVVRALFSLARHYAPSTIFFDEVDSLMSARGGTEHEASRRLKSELLQQMDGLGTEPEKRVMVLGATNRPWDLDEAMRRRLEKRIYIPLPDHNGRLDLLKKLTSQMKLDSTVDLKKIADMAEGYSGADMNIVIRDAGMMPMRRLVSDRSPTDIAKMKAEGKMVLTQVTMKDFLEALKKVQASVSQASLSEFSHWAAEYGST